MVSLLQAAGIVGGLVAASWAHELTHYLTARAFGRRATIRWLALECLFETEGEDDPVERYVALAPFSVGVVVGGLWLLVNGVPAGLWGLTGSAMWTSYTLLGVSDIYRSVQPPVDWDALDESARLVVLAVTVAVVGVVVGMFPHTAAFYVEVGFGLAAMLLGAYGLIEYDRTNPARGR